MLPFIYVLNFTLEVSQILEFECSVELYGNSLRI